MKAAEWRRLAERAGHVFATREWLLTWWRHYGKARRQLSESHVPAAIRLRSCRCTSGGSGAFPCCGSSDTARATNSDPSAHHCSETGGRRRRQGGHGRRSAAALRAARRAGRRRSAFRGADRGRPLYREASPVLRFEHDSWDEFLRDRGRNFRQQVRRFPRKLSELGTVSYRLATDPERLPRDLDILFHLHRQRWGNDATAFLLAAPFHRDFAAQALQQGWLRLWFLEIDDKPVAALYGFRFAGAESAYQSGRDPAFGQQPVGFVLLAHAVREALTDGMYEFRLLRGGAPYKERFATSDPGLETYGLPRGAPAQLMLAAARAVGGRSLGLRRILDRI